MKAFLRGIVGGALLAAVVVVVVSGLAAIFGGCGSSPRLEASEPGGEPVEISQVRAGIQEAMLVAAEVRNVFDEVVGPKCENVAAELQARHDRGVLTLEQFREESRDCYLAADIDVRLVGPGPELGGALGALEAAADRYETTRDRSGFDALAPCVLGLLVDAERLARDLGRYDLDGPLEGIKLALAGYADEECRADGFETRGVE